MRNKIRDILLATVVILPVVAGLILWSVYIEMFHGIRTPTSSWLAIAALTVYSMIKIDLKNLMEKRYGTGKDSEQDS